LTKNEQNAKNKDMQAESMDFQYFSLKFFLVFQDLSVKPNLNVRLHFEQVKAYESEFF